jgi:hypothetical protein
MMAGQDKQNDLCNFEILDSIKPMVNGTPLKTNRIVDKPDKKAL